MPLRNSAAAVVLVCAGCASYTTPGGPAPLAKLGHADEADASLRQPSPHFPANIAVVRVQAPEYKSYTSGSVGSGRFSVLTTRELLTDTQLKAVSDWPQVEAVATFNPSVLPPKLDSLDDLRLAAAKLQTDILLVYTIDTLFRVQGRAYRPQSSIPLKGTPDADAYVASTATVLFTDVRTGFTFGEASATGKASGLAEAWGSGKAVDKKRLEAETLAFTALFAESEKTWAGIAQRYQ